MTIGLETARRRMRAVIAVLDEHLAGLDDLLRTPLPRVKLAANDWSNAESARIDVETACRTTQIAAAEALENAVDWRAKATLARDRGEEQLADQADQCADAAEREAELYTAENAAFHAFLADWARCITQAQAG